GGGPPRWGSDLGGQGRGFEGEAGGFVGDDLVFLGQSEADVVVAFEQAPACVVVDLEGHGDGVARHGLFVQIHGDRGAGVVLEDLPDQFDVGLFQLGGQ